MRHVLWGLLGIGTALPLAAQGVSIAPVAVVIDHRVRSGSVLLYNPGDQPAEVTISLLFGYPITDSAGNIVLKVVEQPGPDAPSAAEWLQAFPRRLMVMPQERQTVRILARPPAGLPDGEYWARLVVAAKGGAVPVTGVPDTQAIQIGLTLEVRSILGVAYRKGAVRTGLRLDALQATRTADTLVIRPRMTRTGSGAYLGTVHAELVDSAGMVRGEFSFPTSVYFTLEPRYTMAVDTLAPGRYRLRLTVRAERPELPPGTALPAPPVSDSVEVRIP